MSCLQGLRRFLVRHRHRQKLFEPVEPSPRPEKLLGVPAASRRRPLRPDFRQPPLVDLSVGHVHRVPDAILVDEHERLARHVDCEDEDESDQRRRRD